MSGGELGRYFHQQHHRRQLGRRRCRRRRVTRHCRHRRRRRGFLLPHEPDGQVAGRDGEGTPRDVPGRWRESHGPQPERRCERVAPPVQSPPLRSSARCLRPLLHDATEWSWACVRRESRRVCSLSEKKGVSAYRPVQQKRRPPSQARIWLPSKQRLRAACLCQ